MSGRSKSVYGWVLCAGLAAAALTAVVPPAQAQSGNETILDAREALRKKDRNRLAAARAAAQADRHALTQWVEYWELSNRLGSAQQEEVDAFYARWSGTYVEDRLRNDWLLELGHRRDWKNFAADFPRFRMNDDREVTCYALLTDHLAGKDVRDAARAAWFAQRDADEGCALMAATLFEAGRLTTADVWRKARLATDANRPRAVRQAMALLPRQDASGLDTALDLPARYLVRLAGLHGRNHHEMVTLALIRLAANEPDVAAGQLVSRWERDLPPELAAWAWAAAGKQAALQLSLEAPKYFQRAALLAQKNKGAIDWPDDMLAWKARAALRSNGAQRWPQVAQAIAAMSPAEQADAAWVYWRARALQGMSEQAAAPEAEAQWAQAQALLVSIAGRLDFYGALAAEDLGREFALPPRPTPPSASERDAALLNPGLARALLLISIGLRNEGVREWNFTLRGMSDRELLAAAQLACDREVWDRCINTSDRTRMEIDVAQRFPMPFLKDVAARSRDIDLDPAYVYGLIRQESRFVMDARSGVGASGLMQVMPATAKWTAKKIGMDYAPSMLTDRDANIRIGTGYLKLVLEDFGGSQPLAAAAYNAGPSRSRRWRDGPLLEPAIWAENIPFNETRDYVKKVLSNATFYAALLGAADGTSIKSRLGRPIGPRAGGSSPVDKDLP
ncbi:MAG: lytic transglycosylase domain-containing protein [Piscinibacter sp.]|nr:lytic transglycosylase domain-containing protein [Piscinibacter sp.]